MKKKIGLIISILAVIAVAVLLIGSTGEENLVVDADEGKEVVDKDNSKVIEKKKISPKYKVADKEKIDELKVKKEKEDKDEEVKVKAKEVKAEKIKKAEEVKKSEVADKKKAEASKKEEVAVEKVTESKKEVTKPKPKPKKAENKKSMEQVAKEVTAGKWGSGTDRKSKLKASGYDPAKVQQEVNKTAKKASPPKQKASSNGENASTQAKSAAKTSKGNYQANRIYINGSSMPMQSTSMGSLQSVIDNTTYKWISLGNYNPNDNRGTYFGMHSHTGGDVIYSLRNGNSVIATDSSGNPHTYVVDKVIIENHAETFTDEIQGNLNKEYIILQTSEPRVNGNRNGNRHVFATKK